MNNNNYSEIKFDVDGKEHTAFISYYPSNGNRAVATKDEMHFPHCKISTNPEFLLDDNVIAVREDESTHLFEKELDALVNAKIIEKIIPEQRIAVGYTEAVLYRVNVED